MSVYTYDIPPSASTLYYNVPRTRQTHHWRGKKMVVHPPSGRVRVWDAVTYLGEILIR